MVELESTWASKLQISAGNATAIFGLQSGVREKTPTWKFLPVSPLGEGVQICNAGASGFVSTFICS